MWRRALGTTLGWGVQALDRITDGAGDLRRTTAFLRGRVQLRARPDDVYVATYPRSGTTWMQFLLHVLARGPDVDFRHITDVSPWFERSLAIGTMQAVDLDRLPSPRIFKTHLPRQWLPATGRFIALVRDPADVALSYYALYRDYLGFGGTQDEFVERFAQGRVQYGSWWKHVQGWQRHAEDPNVRVLRYEALRADPAAVLGQVARFAGLSTDPARVRAAVAAASRDRMKAQEDRFDHATSLLLERGVSPRSFIGAGRVGAGAGGLTPAQHACLAQAGRREWGRWELRLPDFLH